MDILQRLQEASGYNPDSRLVFGDAAAEILKLRQALERIKRWEGEFPETGRYWDAPENTRPMSFGSCYGSMGEINYMRNLASQALEVPLEPIT